ncbi:hypothetical protein [Thalassotalea crassostreae]|uniref:hypothetical protein n=1 Tax=Thalassotalea crassostreae TaxID=1763536 RepID=UPI000839584F|nr:hypothetical protein [Thalassotalea crassostreae]
MGMFFLLVWIGSALTGALVALTIRGILYFRDRKNKKIYPVNLYVLVITIQFLTLYFGKGIVMQIFPSTYGNSSGADFGGGQL